MKRYQVILSIAVITGVPLCFLILSLITQEWGYFLWSIVPACIVGAVTYQNAKSKNNAYICLTSVFA
ncbi:hypothetical protein [Aquisalibacillus elongatus]|uniref:Uncharacterized protein n=1 Tax=Aquisalibacillus elongatus TaxID=485577 RepID=A0A3N5BQX2_9BACI|nr:hypothetical protein EDC24_2168 [Aquisalibacillus elongatus]